MFIVKCSVCVCVCGCTGAECCMKLKRFDEAVKWCDIGLKVREVFH